MRTSISQVVANVVEAADSAMKAAGQALDAAADKLLGAEPANGLALAGAGAGDVFADLSAPLLSSRRQSSGRGGKGAVADVRIELLKEQYGVDKRALKALGSGGLDAFMQVLEKGPKTAALAINILKAVHQTSKGREAEAMEKLRGYDGAPFMLSDFLRQMDTFDPYVATARAQLVLLPAEDGAGVRGASGHVLTGSFYSAYDPDRPPSTIGFFAKRDGLTSIFETFAPGKFSETRERTVRAARAARVSEVNVDITLGELERDPEAVRQFHSPILARELAVYQDLKRAIEMYKTQADQVLYSGVAQEAVATFRVRTDPGGALLGWFKRQIDAGKDIPPGLVLAVQWLDDPRIDLDPARERDLVRGLLAYQRLHSFISTEAALSGAAADLDAYRALAPDDPLRPDSRILDAEQELRALEVKSGSEMSLNDFGNVVSHSGLVEFRRAMNERCLQPWAAEVEEARAYFESLWRKDGTWRADALEESAPLGRLRETVYGAKIGVARPDRPDDRQAALTPQEFRALHDLYFHSVVTQNDLSKLLCALPIPHFRTMVEGVVRAYRKARYFDAQLEQFQEARAQAGQGRLEFDREHVGAVLDEFRPAIPAGNGLRPIETSAVPPQAAGWSAEELLECAQAKRYFGQPSEKRALAEATVEAAAGLVSDAGAKLITRLAKVLPGQYIRAVDIPEVVQAASASIESPLVRVISGPDLLRHKYFDKNQRTAVQEAAELLPTVKALGMEPNERNDRLGAIVQRLTYATVYRGEIVTDDRGRRLSIKGGFFKDDAGEESGKWIAWYDPKKLEPVLERFEREFTTGDKVTKAEVERLQHLCSRKAAGVLQRQGLTVVDDQTFNTVRHMHLSDSTLVSRSLLELAEQIGQGKLPREPRSAPSFVGPSKHFALIAADGTETVYLAFGQYANVALADAVAKEAARPGRDRMSYFKFMQRGNFPDHVKAMAKKVVEMGASGSFSQEAFLSWVRRQEWA